MPRQQTRKIAVRTARASHVGGLSGVRQRPLIGLSADAGPEKFTLSRSYVDAVLEAGGTPVILPCVAQRSAEFVAMCDGIILTGGDDPITTRWGEPLHPKAKPVDPARQDFELALLDAMAAEAAMPALGICLGMQLMGLHAGGKLDQHLADTLPTAEQHWDRRAHEVSGALGQGIVHSHHRQALVHCGSMQVIARAPDGVIEAIRAAHRPFYVGVQWHPERTEDATLGVGVIQQLVRAAREHAARGAAGGAVGGAAVR
jgi:putative glutamine amidotransferase